MGGKKTDIPIPKGHWSRGCCGPCPASRCYVDCIFCGYDFDNLLEVEQMSFEKLLSTGYLALICSLQVEVQIPLNIVSEVLGS
jgi:hypothetical protein